MSCAQFYWIWINNRQKLLLECKCWCVQCHYGGALRSFKPCFKASTVSMSPNTFYRQFHWYMVCGKNNCLYSIVFFCHCAKFMSMFTSSIGICRYYISLLETFAISFTILCCIVNHMIFLLCGRFFQPSSCIILVTLLGFEKSCVTNLVDFLCTFSRFAISFAIP